MLPPFRRCPVGVSEERLWGGLDLTATLTAGRTVSARGLLAEADGGVVLVGSAERMSAGMAARLGAVLDAGEVCAERDGVSLRHEARVGLVLLDEGMEDEMPPASLLDRLAFRVDLDGVRMTDAIALTTAAREVEVEAGVPEALCATAEALGVSSARATVMALRVARAVAALEGRAVAGETDAACAARLVLAHRATRRPAEIEPEATGKEEEEPHEEPADERQDGTGDTAATVLAAAVASLPAGLLSGAEGVARAAGRAPGRTVALRGRPLPARPGRPGGGARLALVDTLRAAAGWQRLRPARPGRRVVIRGPDLRVRRFESRSRTTAVFAVDASGSAALHRLAEAKGAVELLLADCYVRRDQVALIAFRGCGAELLLPPTGALARARRCLASLPGGGGTPLAAGLDAAFALASGLKRRGEAPLVVVLTDGRANVARDGTADRGRAVADAMASGSLFGRARLPGLVIDISPRAHGAAALLASSMGARCVMLPQADAAALSRMVRAA